MAEQEDADHDQRKKFISGVVEGFYGRPWSAEQRRLLFVWMQKFGLNTYMYAPKDDYKHRAYWRDLYSVEEAENLTSLITAAKDKTVTFVYAISPGLDISFSNAKDVQALKRKLEQVATFGCDAFALLFDDIDPELSEADRSAFQSFGAAQVSVSNEVFEHLNQPKLFLFCPTEYCASRAVPNVVSSEYLNTLGSKLLPGIDVMWTGPRVVSKKLSIASLEEIASVLKRPCVIWDNIHANDYDPRRIFLGPYEGRSPEIVPYINGVMTNPNTEFEANFVAIHTLGQFCKSNPDGVKKDILNSDRLSPIASDIKLETESDFSSDEDFPSRIDCRYQPKQALKKAMVDWILEIQCQREPPRQPFPRVIPTYLQTSGPPGVPLCLPQGPPVIVSPSPPPSTPPGVPSSAPGNPSIPPGVAPFTAAATPLIAPSEIPSAAQPCMDPAELDSSNVPSSIPYLPPSPPAGLPLPDIIKTCLTPASTTSSISSTGMITPVPVVSTSSQPPIPITTFMQPPSIPVSSLSDMPDTDSYSISDSASAADCGEAEPMDVVSDTGDRIPPLPGASDSSIPTASDSMSLPKLEKQNSSDSLMQVEGSDLEGREDQDLSVEYNNNTFTQDDMLLFAELFYMPFEHGGRGLVLLQKLHWLRNNAVAIAKKGMEEDTKSFEATEWHHLEQEFADKVEVTVDLLKKLVNGPNKSFMCDMYSYVWDLVSILKICRAYVKWLAKGLSTHPLAQQTYSCVTWFSKGYRDAFISGDQEPWVFRGGLQAELQRLLPIDSAHDLFYIKPPDYIVSKTYDLRPYKPEDKDAVYHICLKTCDDGMDGTDVFPDYPELIGDKLLGKMLTLSGDYGFVIEDDVGVCGYVLMALDAKELAKKAHMTWKPAMSEKYPQIEKKENLSPSEEVILGLLTDQYTVPEDVYTQYPSVLRLDMLPARVEDPAIPRRLLACALSALKCCGSKGAHVVLSVGDKLMADFYSKLGFFPIQSHGDRSGDEIFLGRPF